ncbi:MAG: hypothetical protein JWL58_4289 [Streptosporangiaceae bacterium]|jgi:hypothetical protein|nr:hypothetical protein [Streptosporangiaceae bacterium]
MILISRRRAQAGRSYWARRRILRVFVVLVLVAGASACSQGGPRVPGNGCPATSGPGLIRGSAQEGPVFFVTNPGGCSAQAYTYTGERTVGRLIFPPCVEACSKPAIAPDGSVPSAPTKPSALVSAIWAPDSRRMCGFLNGYVRPIRVGWFDVRAPQHLHISMFPSLFGHLPTSSYNLRSCDITADRAVVTAESNSPNVDAVAVVSLAKRKILFQRDFTGTAAGPVTEVAVAPNGLDMAIQHADHPPPPKSSPSPVSCSPSRKAGRPFTMCALPVPPAMPPPTPTRADLYTLIPTPRPIGRIAGKGIVGWSGDGSRLITWARHGPTGIGDVVEVLRAIDGRVIWQITSMFNAAATAPGVPSLAIQTYDPTRNTTTIHLIDTLGTKRLDAAGQLLPIP